MPARRIRIDLAYDGTDFEGFQLQPRGRTVQGTVEAVLERLAGGRLVRLRAASRTDSGVHARKQVVDCGCSSAGVTSAASPTRAVACASACAVSTVRNGCRTGMPAASSSSARTDS
jgi:tRNA U38,U39,U40 pseudouridine synthase TruA